MTLLSDILADEIKILGSIGFANSIELKVMQALQQLALSEEAFQGQVLDLLNQILNQFSPTRVPTNLRVGIPRLVNRTTGEVLMPGPYSVSNDHDLKLDLVWTDDQGPVAPQPGGTTITSDNTAVVSGGTVGASDSDAVLAVVPGATGTAHVTFANPGPPAVSVTEMINVGTPAPTALGTANPVSVPHGTLP